MMMEGKIARSLDYVPIAKTLREALDESGYGMAKRLGISSQRWYQWEKGIGTIELRLLPTMLELWEESGGDADEFWELLLLEGKVYARRHKAKGKKR